MASMFHWFKKSPVPPTANTGVPKQIQKIGNGEIGLKSKGLLAEKGKAIESGIIFPSLVPITSEIFQEVSESSGASKAKSELEAYKCFYKHELPPSLVSQVSDAIFSFDSLPNTGMATMVRADDWPVGIGLTYSGPAAITGEQLEDGLQNLYVGRVIAQLKRVWASSYSENFQIFARMKGLNEIGAAMLMPMLGAPVMSKRDGANDILYTPLSINFLGYFGSFPAQKAVFSVGPGLGGANKLTDSDRTRGGVIADLSLQWSLSMATIDSKHDPTDKSCPFALDMTRSHLAPSWSMLDFRSVSSSIEYFLNNLKENTVKINQQISAFASGRQLYAEFVMPCFDSTSLALVQSSPVKFISAEKPSVDGKSIIFEGNTVIGSTFVSTKKVRFAGATPTKEDIIFNKENKGYLLVVSVPHALLRSKWELKHLYNAGAVVFCVGTEPDILERDIINDFSTHLGGYFRELGIPVLGVESEKAAGFKQRLGKESECLVFADEFSRNGGSEGFVALI
ncbi:MAG: hypothetical protein NT051_01490 [Candidatus Micrarchaeota archaeon]|nr:hypothetical protein [Candidatus Micrarchaeota archaeon]